jgi:plastocyanin
MTRSLTGAAALALSLLLGACSAGGAVASPVATSQVNLPPSYRFEPAAITVPDGTTVTWTNNDHFTHNVRLLDDGGDVLQLPPGESVTYTFRGPGEHRYDCSFHPNDMTGVVVVTQASAGAR